MPVTFHTVLHRLKSPENVGWVVRQHVAFGGGKIVFVGNDRPWRFKKNAQAFSRRLEKLCEILFFPDDDAFFAWSESHGVKVLAIEIAPDSRSLPDYSFPPEVALVVGNEGTGIPQSFLRRADAVLTIPQFGEVACLNAAASAIIAMYEIRRREPAQRRIDGSKYRLLRPGAIANPVTGC